MKKLLAIVMTFAIAFGVCSLAFASEDGFITTVDSVTDVPEGWTAIRTAEDLNNIRNDLAGKYILMNDIDLSVYDNWSPIGDATTPFTGILDGNGYTIENMKITVAEDEEAEYAAFFGATQNATISNLTIVCDIDVLSKIGSDKHIRVATFVGRDVKNTQIINCVADGSILINTDLSFDVGGIATSFRGNMEKCLSDVDLDIKSTRTEMYFYNIGGIAGYNYGSISKTANTGKINVLYEGTGTLIMYIGGICGSLGSMATSATGDISDCYNSGDISIDSSSGAAIGGISGYAKGNICNAYSFASINTSGENVFFDELCRDIIFWDNDILGTGREPQAISKLENCYYKGVDNIYAYDKELAVNVKELTVEEFARRESFEGFDFESIWMMDEELGRPVFIDENAKEPTTEVSTEMTTVESTAETVTEESTTEITTEELTTESTATEPTTQEFITEATTVTESTTVTEIETTQLTTEELTTENVIETPTEKVEPTTAERTEEVTEPNTNEHSHECRLVRLVKQIIAFIKNVIAQICDDVSYIFG